MSLHPKQEKLLKILLENQDAPLNFTELVSAMEEKSNNSVLHHLKQLEKKGYLKKNPHNVADYQIILEPDKPVVFLPKYGSAKCGTNAIFINDYPEEVIPISPRLINCKADDAFILEASGDSMESKIHDKDLVICKKTNDIRNGDIVACSINGEAKIKEYQKLDNGIILLKSHNSNYPAIAVQEGDELWIGAKVIQVISNNF